VLVVDDEPQVLVALEDVLADDFVVLKAGCAADALAILNDDPNIAVIVTDQRMPNMTGDELLSTISKHRAARILLTGYANLPAVVRAVNEGRLFAYVTKPWNADDLCLKVHTAAERVRLEQALETERQELRRRTLLLQSVLDCMGEGLIVTDAAGQALIFNRKAEAILGSGAPMAPAREWAGTFGLSLPSESAPAVPDTLPFCRVLNGEDRVDLEMRIDNPLVSNVQVAATSTPLLDDSHTRQGSITVLRDVTLQHQLEAQLIQAQKMEVVGQLASGVAHDFNNLLAATMGYVELILLDTPDSDPRRRDLEEVLAVTRRGVGLTRQLLGFSRKQTTHLKALDLNRLITDLSRMLERILGKHTKLTTRLDPEAGSVTADAGQIEQILLNLVVNARDAMRDGGTVKVATSRVVVAAQDEPMDSVIPYEPVPPGQYVKLSVTDTGVGMNEQTRAQIFEPFFTTKGPGKGTGLGLSTVLGIVKRFQGSLLLETKPHCGSSFVVLLPRADAPAAQLETAPRRELAQAGSATILIVDDDDAVRNIAARILALKGYEVLDARGPRVARELWNQHRAKIDLVLSDIMLPETSGVKLIHEFRRTRPSLRALYMSGYPAAEQQGGDVTFVEKPFSSETLTDKVRAALDQ
jgi:signal transduction histidine kinase/response regulator RpfG family c-di-GMP phosphodiesterase